MATYNGALEAECATYANCLFDGDALFDHAWLSDEVSTVDNVHPSAAGQQMISTVLYGAGYTWVELQTAPPPPPSREEVVIQPAFTG